MRNVPYLLKYYDNQLNIRPDIYFISKLFHSKQNKFAKF